MGDPYQDIPPLVDPQRFDGSAPMMMMNNSSSWPSVDSLRGHTPVAAQPHSWSPGPAFLQPPQWGGWDAQATAIPLSWGSSVASTPPMLTAPAAVMPPMVSLAVHSDGWPRPLAGREPKQDNGLPWKNYDDDYEQSPPARSRTPLSRSVSLSSSPSTASLHRAGSFSRQTSLVRGNAAEALKRPPREWRTDFTLGGSGLLSGLLGTRARSKSIGGGANEPKVTLHPFIRYTSYKPPMTLDLRESPNMLKFRGRKDQPLTTWDLMRFVCEPPLPFMRLYHAQLPWYIDVETQNPSGVTLYDMFCAINQCMMAQIQNADYYNVEMSSETRAQVADAWAARCRNEEERQQGIRRVDYLMGRVIMEGIQKGKDGLWEIKTRKQGPS